MVNIVLNLKKHISKKNWIVIGIIAGLLILPVMFVVSSRDTNLFSNASTVNTFEPETGTLSGTATVVNDAIASRGQAVDFGTSTGTACTGVQLTPGQDIQAAINANPDGATFCFAPGVYRLSAPLVPKNNQQLIGAYGAILNGSKVVTGFTQSGTNWVATGFLPSSPNTHGQCSTPGCSYTQDVFIDGQPLARVINLADLAPGKFYQDFAANKIYVKDDPTGRLVEQSYASAIVNSAATGVTVKNFVIEKAATQAQDAAIRTLSNPAGWIIEDNDIRFNHAGGVYANNGSTVRNNYVHHQGQSGIYGDYGAILVENNEVAFNNTAGFDSIWEAGGSKWSRTDGTIIRGNYFHDNNGPGIWTDILNQNVLIENNVAVRNKQVGIFHEISYSAIIRNNISMDNTNICAFSFYCGAQILVSASRDVEVYGNTVRGWGGIGMLQQDREADYPSPLGLHIVQNVNIHDNNMHSVPVLALAGAVTDTGDNSVFTSRNNRYANNHYHLGDMNGQYFYWLNDDRTISDWQSFGMDTAGTFDSNVETGPAPVPQLTVGPKNGTTSGSAISTITVPANGSYRVWSRIMAPDSTNNSYKLQIDNGTPITVGNAAISSGSWTWVDYRDGSESSKLDVTLTAGTHTLTLSGSEANVKVDRVILTTDTACVPNGIGDNCTIVDVPTPTNTPVPPTNTPTPTHGTGTPVNVGYQTVLSGQFDSGNSNGMTSTQVVSNSSSGALTSISVYIGAVNAAPGNHMQVALYADNGVNSPGARLATSGAQVLTANSWNTFPLSGVSIAPNTKYWIVFNVDGSATQYGWSSRTTGLSAWKIPTTYGTWPNPFGTPSEPNGVRAYALYMTYLGGGVVNTPTPTPVVPTNTPAPVQTMTVSNITMASSTAGGQQRNISTTVTVVNEQTGARVPSAVVSLRLTSPKGAITNLSGTTNTNGTVTLTKQSKDKGTWSAAVTNVTRSGFTYRPTNTTSSIVVN